MLRSRLLISCLLAFWPVVAGAQGAPQAQQDASGTCTTAAGGTVCRTLTARAADNLSVADFGAVCDGATDSAASLQAGLNAVAARGGGRLNLGSARCAVLSADLSIPSNVELFGNPATASERAAGNYLSASPALIVSPDRTVRLAAGSALRGVNVLRQGLTEPKDLRAGLSAVAAFAGTGLTIGGASDAVVEDILVIGFGTCVNITNSERPRLNRVFGDCTNGLILDQIHDVGRIAGVHWWPYMTTHQPWTATKFAVARAANNGSGLVRLTLSAPMASPSSVVAGDLVQVADVKGVPHANGRFKASVVDSTHIDLLGSSFDGTYASGGTVFLNANRRSGIGFTFTNQEFLICRDCFAYGFDFGIKIGTGAVWVELVDSAVDNLLETKDPTTIGVSVEGNADRIHMFGGFISSYGTSIRYDTTNPNPSLIDGVAIGATGPGNAVALVRGSLMVNNSTLTGGYPVYVSEASTKLMLVGTDRGGSPLNFQSSSAQGHVTEIGPNMFQLSGCHVLSGGPAPTMNAPDCSIYLRSGAGGSLYVRQSGAWVAK